MNKSELIRAMPADMHYRVVAESLGVPPSYVASIRSKAKKPDHYRQISVRGSAAYRERNFPNRVPNSARWNAEKQKRLEMMLASGKSFTQIADALGETKGKIAGRVFRMRNSR